MKTDGWLKADSIMPIESGEYTVCCYHKHDKEVPLQKIMRFHSIGDAGAFETGPWIIVTHWNFLAELPFEYRGDL